MGQLVGSSIKAVHGMVLFTQEAENMLAAAPAVSSAVGVEIAKLILLSYIPFSWLHDKFGHWIFADSSRYEAI